MNATRRRMLSIIAGVPIVGPLATKLALDQQTMLTTGIAQSVGQTSWGMYGQPQGGQTPNISRPLNYPAMFNVPWFKSEVESVFYEEHRRVSFIDHDIACLRSLSMSAKIAFQRQRNVKNAMNDKYNLVETNYQKLDKAFKRLNPFST